MTHDHDEPGAWTILRAAIGFVYGVLRRRAADEAWVERDGRRVSAATSVDIADGVATAIGFVADY